MCPTYGRLASGRFRLAFAASLLSGLIASGPLYAEDTRNIDVPAGPLADALQSYARQSGVEILYRVDQLRGLTTQGVNGPMPPAEAVRKLLRDTPLVLRQDSSGAMVVALPLRGDAIDVKPIAQQRILLAQAQATPTPTSSTAQAPIELQEIVVVGSNIKNSELAGVLPVTVLNDEAIQTTGATTGDELFRSIAQTGTVAFNEGRTTGGINDARGDVASINLRGLGTGNTLMLLNGRRMVLHPGTQAENLVPVTSVNTNSIPILGIRRVEVLRDGASAIYGSDAVAGVINTVLRSDFEGFAGELQYGGSEGTDLREATIAGQFGMNFNDNRSNVSFFASYYDRDGMMASARPYSASSDLRPLVVGTPFEGDTDFDNRSTSTPWGAFQTVGSVAVRQNGSLLTSSTGLFHIQPDFNAGCRTTPANGICIDDGAISGAADRNLRYDLNSARSLVSDGRRANAFAFINHRFKNDLEWFSELGYYDARTVSQREQASSLSSARITVPAYSYYNPFGPVTFPDSSPNPNRLPGLNAPVQGLALDITGYRPIDAPPRRIVVDDENYRLLTGLRYALGDWDFESAVLYSQAKTVDRTYNRISNTLFQQALSLSTPDAYNPFNGGDVGNVTTTDATPSAAATIDSFLIDVYRASTTTLALWDLRVSNARLLALPGGDLGAAAGVEWRRESFIDDRDPRLDGTITYTNTVTGLFTESDVMGSSPTIDTSGHRHVVSAYLEFGIPIVGREMAVPLVRDLSVQVAGRFEDYSDVGSVTKPKIALAWSLNDSIKLRSAWSQGFRAPNLPQVFETALERVNTRTDYIQCEADLRAGRIATFSACSNSQQVASNRSGSRALKPEDSENFSAGLVLTPSFIPTMTFAVDYWRVRQDGVVGIFGDDNQIALDYLLRVQGSSNPNVIRAAPDATDIANFAGTGLAPAGEIIRVIDNYTNLLPRTADGIDFALDYALKNTFLGNFNFGINVARMINFYQDPSPEAASIIAAQAMGAIDTGFTVDGAQDLMRHEGRPEWRGTVSVNWRKGQWSAGVFGNYVGWVYDDNATAADGTPFVIEDLFTANLYGQYQFASGFMNDASIRLGVRNVTNEAPPLADESYGYLSELHSNRGRYWYMTIKKQF